MAVPKESETNILNLLLKRSLGDRDVDLELLLYTNVGLDLETATAAALTEPSDGSYARKTLTDASWSVSGDIGSYVAQDFTAVTTDMTGIQGAAIVTKAAGGTPRIIAIAAHSPAPLTIGVGQTLRVDLAALTA